MTKIDRHVPLVHLGQIGPSHDAKAAARIKDGEQNPALPGGIGNRGTVQGHRMPIFRRPDGPAHLAQSALSHAAKAARNIDDAHNCALLRVISDKRTVKDLFDAREKLQKIPTSLACPSKLLESFNHMGIFCPLDTQAHHVKSFFDSQNSHALLARTLARPVKSDVPDCFFGPNLPPMRTPARVERDTLNNRLGSIDILMTPSTMIDPDTNVSTISDRPDRERWHRMPSVLYTAPKAQNVDMLGKVDGFKKMFGNALSFASNQGFTEEFKDQRQSGGYSHAQLLDIFRKQPQIQKNLKGDGELNSFKQSFGELKQQVLILQTPKDADMLQPTNKAPALPSNGAVALANGSVPHNEVIARLWLWDAVAVDMGPNIRDGLSSAIELQLARKALSMELTEHGIGHPLFNDFLEQQLSVGEGNISLDQGAVAASIGSMSVEDKKAVVTALLEKLDQPISLCMYEPAKSNIRGIQASEITATDIYDAMNAVLLARLGPSALNVTPSHTPNHQPGQQPGPTSL